MKRLTSNTQLTEAEAMNLSVTNLYARLKEYEDTGLEPEEVRPMVRGRWNRYEHDGEIWANYCSVCNIYLPLGLDWEPNFCPNCGADMRPDGGADG